MAIIFNSNQKSRDYENVKNLFRPSHADFTYYHKYGIRDYRGGGRSSARETASRVAGGAIAKLILKELNIEIKSGVIEIDGIKAKNINFEKAKESEIYSLDAQVEEEQKEAILKAKMAHDSVGGVALVKIINAPIGLGEPIYYKMDSLLADAMMSINAVKGVEIGEGVNSSALKGSQNNDQINSDGFLTNHSGGILGGITNSDDIDIKVYFKATPSIFQKQQTVDIHNNDVTCELKGRHDPCVAIRGSIVAESMASLVVADMLLLNMGRQISHLHTIYKS
jgi:chorismate synthase